MPPSLIAVICSTPERNFIHWVFRNAFGRGGTYGKYPLYDHFVAREVG